MGSHARMLAALCAALVVPLAAAAAPAGAMSLTVRAETNGYDVMTPFLARTALTLPTGGPTVDGGCASDSAVAALRQVLPTSTDLGVTPDAPTSPATTTVTQIKGVPMSTLPGPDAGGPTWVVYYGGEPLPDICSSLPMGGSEVLAYLQCGTPTDAVPTPVAPNPATNPCFTGRPLTIQPKGGNLYDVNPFGTSGQLAAIITRYKLPGDPFSGGPAMSADVTTDEGAHFTPSQEWPADGTTYISFTNRGEHPVVATETVSVSVSGKVKTFKMVPDRMRACVSEGSDGYCGSTYVPPPDNPLTGADPQPPCETNGHDGHCGTVDTSGPPTTVTNINNKAVFSKKRSPTKLAGKIAVDESGVKQVLVRLTRVVTTKVVVKHKKTKKKAKKKPKVRYRTIKHCTYWSDRTLLFEKAKKCGATYGTWFPAEVTDIPTDFSYSFEMHLPAGTYVLEVEAYDVDGHPEDVTPGRNVLTFTVR